MRTRLDEDQLWWVFAALFLVGLLGILLALIVLAAMGDR